MSDRLSSFGRGASQGATLGWGDEGVAALLAALEGPTDSTGIPREYAAGSAQADYLNSERASNEEAQRAFPKNYGGGQLLGGLPLAMSLPGGGGIASRAAIGGGLGAVSGAGGGVEGTRGTSALMGGALGGAGGAALASAPKAYQALKNIKMGPPPGGGGGGMVPAASSALPSVNNVAPRAGNSQINVNMSSGRFNRPPAPSASQTMPPPVSIPRPGKLPSQEELASFERVADDADNLTSAATQRLVERSLKQEAQRSRPIDIELERARQAADSARGRAPTVKPPPRIKPPELPVGKDIIYNSALREGDAARYYADDPSHSAAYVPRAKYRFDEAYNNTDPVEGVMRAARIKPDARVASPEVLLEEYAKQVSPAAAERIRATPWMATEDPAVVASLKQQGYHAIRAGGDPVPNTDSRVFSNTTMPLDENFLEQLGQYKVRVHPTVKGSTDLGRFSILPPGKRR